MQFHLDKKQKSTLFEQAREQLISALHMGRMRSGDRLPSVRQVALRNHVNLKTAFSIYQRLREEGYIEIRMGSGAYVTDLDRLDLDQAYCLSVFHLIKSNLSQASQLRLDPRQYARLVQNFIGKTQRRSTRIAVVECNNEQIHLFASEISDRLKVTVVPVLLDRLENPDRRLSRLLTRFDYFVTTDYHFAQVKELGFRYGTKTLQVRLNPAFVPMLIGAARRGPVLMVVSDTTFFPGFRHNMLGIGIPSSVVEQILAIDEKKPDRVREMATSVKSVYISPICDPGVRQLLPPSLPEIKIDTTLSVESIENLEAILLFRDAKPSSSPS